jgi:putative SbcD/Mre11-related phosphoesterase
LTKLEILYPYSALKLSCLGKNYLVIADLHIGFEHRFNKEGFKILSSIDTMLNTITNLIQVHKPNRLLILGDIKSGFSTLTRDEWKHVPRFMKKIMKLVDISIIPGNHDGGLKRILPEGIRLESKEFQLGDTGFLHGHSYPTNILLNAKRLILGHIHPSFSKLGSPVSGTPVWLKIKTRKDSVFLDYSGEEPLDILVMPSFNAELGAKGLKVFREKMISPIFRKLNGKISEAIIITIDGSVIGDSDSIQYVL